MEAAFVTHCATFLNNGPLQAIATYVKTYDGKFKDQKVEDIVNALRAAAGVPPTPQAAPMSLSSIAPALPSMPGIPAAFAGAVLGGMPSTMQGLGSAPAKKRSSGKKATGSAQVWATIDQYKQYQADFVAGRTQARLCAYCPSRGKDQDKVCCAPAINGQEPDMLKWKCVQDSERKTNKIDKLITSVQGIRPQALAGYNVPTSVPTLPNMMGARPSPAPALPILTTAQAPMLPGFPGAPALPGMPTIPSLPMSAPSLPTVPTLPGLPGMPTLPSAAGMSIPQLPSLPSTAAPAVAAPEIRVLHGNFAPGMAIFNNAEAGKAASGNIVLKEKDDDLYSVGKLPTVFTEVKTEQGQMVAQPAVPADWNNQLQELDAADKAILHKNNIMYAYKDAGKPVAV